VIGDLALLGCYEAQAVRKLRQTNTKLCRLNFLLPASGTVCDAAKTSVTEHGSFLILFNSSIIPPLADTHSGKMAVPSNKSHKTHTPKMTAYKEPLPIP
jgi:hypothetical protein